MKIIIVTGESFPNGMAAVSRIKCFARAFQQGGADCEVLVCRRTEVYGKPPHNTDGNGVCEGIPYRYIGGSPLRGSNVFVRKFNDCLDILHTEHYLKNNLSAGDVLFLYMGDSAGLSIRFIKVARRKGAKCIRELCELPYGTGKETRCAKWMRAYTLRRQFPLLDGVVSISDALLEYAKAHTRPSCKHVKVPIMVDFDKYNLEDASADAEFPYIFHAGTLYEQKDGILGMIEAFGMAVGKLPETVRFVLAGRVEDSPHCVEIERLIEKYELHDRIRFTGYLFGEQLRKYLAGASLVILNKYRTQQNYYGFSTKLGEYLAAGKPIIITDVGEAMNWLKDGETAMVTLAEDVKALSGGIVKVFSDLPCARQIGASGKELCRRCFDYRNWSAPLMDFAKRIVNA